MIKIKFSENSHRVNKTSPRQVRVKSAYVLHKGGFTLVELLVTITMFVIITGVVLVNSNKFDSSVLLHNFAYDVAITIKQAQSYGVNVKESSLGTFTSAYGVYFDISYNTNFVIFNDLNNDKIYGNGDVTQCPANDPINLECIQKYSMTRGTSIASMCVGRDDPTCSNVSKLSILFQRPNLGALIYINGANTIDSNNSSYAKIILSSASGATSTVVVTSIGQIYVKKN